MGNFDLLEHAGEEASGEEAVAKVIAAAEVAQPSEPKERKKKDHQQQQQPDGEGDAYPPENVGQRQGYRRGDGQSRRRNLQDVPKSKPASEAASDADQHQKSEGKVEEPAAEAPQKEAIAANVDATPASESEKSAGDVAKDGPKKPKDPSVKRLTGSQRRKLKKKNPKKEDSNDGDVLEVIEEEKQEMTLEEYEKKLRKKKGDDS